MMEMNSTVRLRLQRVLFVLCACASGALVCPDWREIWYYVLYGDPTLDGGEMTFMIVLIAILAPLAAGSFIGASVITVLLWRKVPAVRIRAMTWFSLFVLGCIPWRAIESLHVSSRLFSDIVDATLLSASVVVALVWLIRPARQNGASRPT